MNQKGELVDLYCYDCQREGVGWYFPTTGQLWHCACDGYETKFIETEFPVREVNYV